MSTSSWMMLSTQGLSLSIFTLFKIFIFHVNHEGNGSLQHEGHVQCLVPPQQPSVVHWKYRCQVAIPGSSSARTTISPPSLIVLSQNVFSNHCCVILQTLCSIYNTFKSRNVFPQVIIWHRLFFPSRNFQNCSWAYWKTTKRNINSGGWRLYYILENRMSWFFQMVWKDLLSKQHYWIELEHTIYSR